MSLEDAVGNSNGLTKLFARGFLGLVFLKDNPDQQSALLWPVRRFS